MSARKVRAGEPGAMPTALRGHGIREIDIQKSEFGACSHAHAKPWAWHPAQSVILGRD